MYALGQFWGELYVQKNYCSAKYSKQEVPFLNSEHAILACIAVYHLTQIAVERMDGVHGVEEGYAQCISQLKILALQEQHVVDAACTHTYMHT